MRWGVGYRGNGSRKLTVKRKKRVFERGDEMSEESLFDGGVDGGDETTELLLLQVVS